jgi:hypothetical protein
MTQGGINRARDFPDGSVRLPLVAEKRRQVPTLMQDANDLNLSFTDTIKESVGIDDDRLQSDLDVVSRPSQKWTLCRAPAAS